MLDEFSLFIWFIYDFNIRIMWRKLPQYLHTRWFRRNYELKKKQKERTPKLQDLVEFVQEAAEEANNPVFTLNIHWMIQLMDTAFS